MIQITKRPTPRACNCVNEAQRISEEIEHLADRATIYKFGEDANFVAGILFTMTESDLGDFVPQFDDIIDASREQDVKKFRKAAYSAAKMIESLKC